MRKTGNWRIFFLALLMVSAGGVIVLRLFFIQVREKEFYRALARGQHAAGEELVPERGKIYLQDSSRQNAGAAQSLYPIAVDKRGYFAYAVPREILKETAKDVSEKLAVSLALDAAVLEGRIKKRSDPYEPIKHRLSDAEAASLKTLQLPGVYLEEETWRYYPAGDLVEPFAGFVGTTGDGMEGLYGIERQHEKTLAGARGWRVGEKDAFGGLLPFRIQSEQKPEDGSSIVLAVDVNIQFAAKKILRETLAKWESSGGLMLVTEPATGKIFAMASEPSYDPNAYEKVSDISVFLNSAIEKIFEPGSVFKPITMSAALNEKAVTPQSTYVDDGVVRIGGYTIRNFDDRAYGVRTMSEVIELSLNTGAVHAQKLLGNERFASYVKLFGFGEKLGIDLPGELKGSISNLKQKAEINYATASFGQGIAATPLQMAAAIGAIANGGALMRPYVAERILRPGGTVEETEPRTIRRVLAPETARAMTRMLVDAVRGKFERRAHVPGYYVAGKTGTAQIPDPKTGGYLPVSEGVIHTFVGYAPAFAPRFLVFIKMDKPVGVRFAANSLTPAFHDLAVYLLNYFSIPPDLPEEVEKRK